MRAEMKTSTRSMFGPETCPSRLLQTHSGPSTCFRGGLGLGLGLAAAPAGDSSQQPCAAEVSLHFTTRKRRPEGPVTPLACDSRFPGGGGASCPAGPHGRHQGLSGRRGRGEMWTRAFKGFPQKGRLGLAGLGDLDRFRGSTVWHSPGWAGGEWPSGEGLGCGLWMSWFA